MATESLRVKKPLVRDPPLFPPLTQEQCDEINRLNRIEIAKSREANKDRIERYARMMVIVEKDFQEQEEIIQRHMPKIVEILSRYDSSIDPTKKSMLREEALILIKQLDSDIKFKMTFHDKVVTRKKSRVIINYQARKKKTRVL